MILKGNNGSLLHSGGSKEYSGAPGLGGMAAIASGVDLCTYCNTWTCCYSYSVLCSWFYSAWYGRRLS